MGLGALGMGLQVGGQIQQTFGEYVQAQKAEQSARAERARLASLQFPRPAEHRRRVRLRDILEAAETGADREVFGINLIQPELFREAGYEVTTDPGSVARAVAARGEVTAAEGRIAGLRSAIVAARRMGKPPKGKKKKTLKRERRNLAQLLRTAEDAEGAVNQPTGIRRIGEPGSAQDRRIIDLLLGRVETAARGQAGADPELERQIAEGERTLHESLRRQLGPDYASSSPGVEALAQFNQRATEARTSFARRDIEMLYPEINQERARLAQTAGIRQTLLARPALLPGEGVRTLGTVAGLTIDELGMFQRDRLAQLAQSFPYGPSAIGIGLVSGGQGMERSGQAVSAGALLGGGGGGAGLGETARGVVRGSGVEGYGRGQYLGDLWNPNRSQYTAGYG